MKQFILVNLFLLTFFSIHAQKTNPHKDFNFWVGKWETTMSVPPKWEKKKGIDEVSVLLNGRLIEEVFKKVDQGKTNFQRGYLTYLIREKRWKHTIYDAKWGEYTFYGNKVGDKMILQSDKNDSRPGMRRETFQSITKNSFEYVWEASYDNGKTWNVEWKVSYKKIVPVK